KSGRRKVNNIKKAFAFQEVLQIQRLFICFRNRLRIYKQTSHIYFQYTCSYLLFHHSGKASQQPQIARPGRQTAGMCGPPLDGALVRKPAIKCSLSYGYPLNGTQVNRIGLPVTTRPEHTQQKENRKGVFHEDLI